MRAVFNRFTYLNSWSSFGVLFGEVMKPVGGTTLLEEAHYWGRALSVASPSPTLLTFSVFPVWLVMQSLSYVFRLPAATPPLP